MIDNKKIHIKKFETFNSMKVSANEDNTFYTIGTDASQLILGEPDIPWLAIVYIKDTKQQWTHGLLYSSATKLSELENDLEFVTKEQLVEDELVTAAALNDLNNRVSSVEENEEVTKENLTSLNESVEDLNESTVRKVTETIPYPIERMTDFSDWNNVAGASFNFYAEDEVPTKLASSSDLLFSKLGTIGFKILNPEYKYISLAWTTKYEGTEEQVNSFWTIDLVNKQLVLYGGDLMPLIGNPLNSGGPILNTKYTMYVNSSSFLNFYSTYCPTTEEFLFSALSWCGSSDTQAERSFYMGFDTVSKNKDNFKTSKILYKTSTSGNNWNPADTLLLNTLTNKDTVVATIKDSLSSVASTGSYNDLVNKPTIGSNYLYPVIGSLQSKDGFSANATSSTYLSTTPKAIPDTTKVPDLTSINLNGRTYIDLGLPSGTLWADTYISHLVFGAKTSESTIPSTIASGNLPLTEDLINITWGGDWHIPTKELFEELLENCTKNGRTFTSKVNGNSITFVSLQYWTGTAYNPNIGYICDFGSTSSIHGSIQTYTKSIKFPLLGCINPTLVDKYDSRISALEEGGSSVWTKTDEGGYTLKDCVEQEYGGYCYAANGGVVTGFNQSAIGKYSHAEGYLEGPFKSNTWKLLIKKIDGDKVYVTDENGSIDDFYAGIFRYLIYNPNEWSAYDSADYISEDEQGIDDDGYFLVLKNVVSTDVIYGTTGGLCGALGQVSHSEGWNCSALGKGAHAEGEWTLAESLNSHAAGYYTQAYGVGSHTEGDGTIAFGSYAHVEGEGDTFRILDYTTKVESISLDRTEFSFSLEGNPYWLMSKDFCLIWDPASYNSKTNTYFIVSLNYNRTDKTINCKVFPKLNSSILVGYKVTMIPKGIAFGDYSHSEGRSTTVGNYSNAVGITATSNDYEHSEGVFNITYNPNSYHPHRYLYPGDPKYFDANHTLHTIGGGTSETNSNVLQVMTNGDTYIIGIGGFDGKNSHILLDDGSFVRNPEVKTVQEAFDEMHTLFTYVKENLEIIDAKLTQLNGE